LALHFQAKVGVGAQLLTDAHARDGSNVARSAKPGLDERTGWVARALAYSQFQAWPVRLTINCF